MEHPEFYKNTNQHTCSRKIYCVWWATRNMPIKSTRHKPYLKPGDLTSWHFNWQEADKKREKLAEDVNSIEVLNSIDWKNLMTALTDFTRIHVYWMQWTWIGQRLLPTFKSINAESNLNQAVLTILSTSSGANPWKSRQRNTGLRV